MKPPRSGGRNVLREERASFGYAFQGIGHAWSTQRHLRIHAVLATLAVLLALGLRISAAEWAVLCLTIATVLALELLNTVVEAVVDLTSPDYHPLARVAKDVAAGAVLIAAFGGVAVGAFLFLPRIWALITQLAR
jgi:diacylglycerol kinase (ATP)